MMRANFIEALKNLDCIDEDKKEMVENAHKWSMLGTIDEAWKQPYA